MPTTEALVGTVIVEVVGDNCTYFRRMYDTDLQDIARTFSIDEDLQAAHDQLWKLSEPVAVEDTAAVEFTVIDDSTDVDSCGESWLEIHEEFEE